MVPCPSFGWHGSRCSTERCSPDRTRGTRCVVHICIAQVFRRRTYAVHARVIWDSRHWRTVLPFAGDDHHTAEQVRLPFRFERSVAELLLNVLSICDLYVVDQRTILQ